MANDLDRRLRWSQAYARQAEADFSTWAKLQPDLSIPECHKLLFIQMACEKLTKAHLCSQGSDPTDLQTSHAYIAKTLPIILRQRMNVTWVIKHAKHLAREIEMLAPALKRGGQRPDNCEYPWEDGEGRLHLPLDWSFTPAKLLAEPAGRIFLRLVREAIGRFR
jgi:hypothetical protein